LFLWMEGSLALLCLLFAFFIPKKTWPWLASIESAFRRLAERRVLSVLLVGVLALVVRIAILPLKPVPNPGVNDEFSFLLAADTFAHGRLTNPPHPMWVHFENLHVLQRPTYASMYPPAQGVFLAVGQWLAGHPFAGLCLVVALFCAATCWMLQGWTSPSLALLGGLFAVVRFGMFSYWANSYWGGATAALGGALVLGALPRVRSSQKLAVAIAMGIGMAILANSRPYEGMVLCIPVVIGLLVCIYRKKGNAQRRTIIRIALPLFAVMLITALATGYYFWRVTGNPFLMPQALERNTYAIAPYFLWQSPRLEPVYNHPFLRDFYTGTELAFYQSNRTVSSIFAFSIVKIFEVWLFYLGPILTLPLVLCVFAAPRKLTRQDMDPDTRSLLTVLACLLLGLGLEVFFFPHYAAPAAPVFLALVMRSLGALRSLEWHGKPTGLFLSRCVPAVCLILVVLRYAAAPLHLTVTSDWPPTWYNSRPTQSNRPKILAELNRLPGKHLVLVGYGKVSLTRLQWVYNQANVDASHVVWAWDMGSARNRELLDYFKDRQVWSLDPDHEPATLSSYSAPNSSQ